MIAQTTKATNYQKKLLHMGKAALGLDDDAYRDILQACGGVRSSVDLDQKGVEAVMQAYYDLGWMPTGGYSRYQPNGRTRHIQERRRRADMDAPISQAMMAKIQHLFHDLGWTDPEKQQQFSRRQCRHPWPQTIRHGRAIIEGLSAILRRKKGKAENAGDQREQQPAGTLAGV